MNPVIVAVLLSTCTVTSYRSVPSQTDDSPYYTSIGEHVNPNGVAVSQDLLKSKKVHYGDVLYIEGVGFKHVNDCMAARHRNAVDVWVETYDQEKKFGVKRKQIWIIKRAK